MGFIKLVRERMEHAADFDQFKRLWPSYKIADNLGIPRPKVYLTIPATDVSTMTWDTLRNRLPNLFVIRPSLFVNPVHDFLIRDDGPRGFMNFSIANQQTPSDALADQARFLGQMPETDKALLFEEFPLTYSDRLGYPLHYRVHTFGGVVGCIQGTTAGHSFWVDTECKVLASGDNRDVATSVPNVGIMDDICAAAKSISLATKLPYIRIDFVPSTQGVLFRSFACTPGDVRSNDHNWFYKENDEQLGQLWEQAARALGPASQQKDEVKVNDNSQEPRTGPSAPPDDNA